MWSRHYNENSNTITIGASGDTIALASGASQTGFGSNRKVLLIGKQSIKTADVYSIKWRRLFCKYNKWRSNNKFTFQVLLEQLLLLQIMQEVLKQNNLTVSPMVLKLVELLQMQF